MNIFLNSTILPVKLHFTIVNLLWSFPQALWIVNWIVSGEYNNVDAQAFKFAYILYLPVALISFLAWYIISSWLQLSSFSLFSGFSYILVSNSILESDNSNLFLNHYLESLCIVVITNILLPVNPKTDQLLKISIVMCGIRILLSSYYFILLLIINIPIVLLIIVLFCGLLFNIILSKSILRDNLLYYLTPFITSLYLIVAIYSNINVRIFLEESESAVYLFGAYLAFSIVIQYLVITHKSWENVIPLIIPQLLFSVWYNFTLINIFYSITIAALFYIESYLQHKFRAFVESRKISLVFNFTITLMCASFLFNSGIFHSEHHLVWSILLATLFFGILNIKYIAFYSDKYCWLVGSMATLLLIFFDLKVTIEEYHQGFFLGPVIDLINGKSPLVDINAQYGVGILYGIASLFLFNVNLISLGNFSLILNVIDIAYAVCFFVILSNLIKNPILSLLLTIAGLVIIRSNPFGGMTPQIFPSTGALRYMWGIFPILVTALKIDLKWRFGWYFVFLFIGSTWSLEALISVIASVLTSLSDTYITRGRVIWKTLFKTAVFVILSSLAGQGGFLILTYIRSGQFANINIYLTYVKLYGTGFGWVSPSLHDVWSLFAFSYFAGLLFGLYVLFKIKDAQKVADASVIISLSMIGFLQASYYVYRAHTSNLYHILWIPYVLMCFCAVAVFKASQDSRNLRNAVVGCFCLVSVLCGGHVDKYLLQLRYSPFGWFAYWSGLAPSGVTGFDLRLDDIFPLRYRNVKDEELFELISEFPKGSEVAMFVPEQHLLRARFGTTIKNKLKISFAPQDEVSDIGREIAFQSVYNIKAGEVVLVARDTLKDRGIMLPLLMELCKTRSGDVVYSSENIVKIRIRETHSEEYNICRELIK